MSTTIARELSFEGVGLHSGNACKVVLHPLDSGGIYFKTEGGCYSITDAVIEEDQRLTGFAFPDGSVVRTAEHLLASVVGMGIDNIVIEPSGSEMPILDGSASVFAESISDAGITDNGKPAVRCALQNAIGIDDAEHGRSVVAIPSDRLIITYVIDYSGTPIGVQHVSYEITRDIFLKTVSKARTFCLTSEFDYLKANGLAKGGSLDNAMVFGDKGLVNAGGLRMPLECVTHKVADFLGDLALTGTVPTAHYIGICSGHEMHNKLTDKLKRVFSCKVRDNIMNKTIGGTGI